MNQIILTEEGKLKLEQELKEIKEIRLPEIIEKIEQAKEMGDLSENAEYHDAKDQQGLMMAKVKEIDETLKNAVVSEISTSKSEIGLGTTFVVEDASGNKKQFTMVGFNEADPINGRISNESPIGQAFMYKSKGQTVEFKAPKGLISYKILEIK